VFIERSPLFLILVQARFLAGFFQNHTNFLKELFVGSRLVFGVPKAIIFFLNVKSQMGAGL